jgi:hypothetical protein
MQGSKKFALLSYLPNYVDNLYRRGVQEGWHTSGINRVFVGYFGPDQSHTSLETEFLREFDHVIVFVNAVSDKNTLSMLGALSSGDITLVMCPCNFDRNGNLEAVSQTNIDASGLTNVRHMRCQCSDRSEMLRFIFEGITRHNIYGFLQHLSSF